MKAKIWKDRLTGRWCWDVRSYRSRFAGERDTWADALAEALDAMRWISFGQGALT